MISNIAFPNVLGNKRKPVVSLAPDALVFLNGTSGISSCTVCKKYKDLHNDLTQVSCQLPA